MARWAGRGTRLARQRAPWRRGRPASAAGRVITVAGQQGMVTVEAALAVVTLVVAALLTSIVPSAVAAQVRCADAAREVALLVAREEPAPSVGRAMAVLAPTGATLEVSRSDGWVTVQVASSVPTAGPLAGGLTLSVSGSAVARLEPGTAG